jgi:uncharacterized protein (TIGR03083 family)
MDHASAYARAHQRIVSLVDETAAIEVPTCPGWTVKDLIAHQADLLEVAATDPKSGFSDGWGERGVEQRRDRSLEEVLTEWERRLDENKAVFDSSLAQVAVADVLAHEQDIRTALGKPGAMDDEGIVGAVQMALSFLRNKTKDSDLSALHIVTDELDETIGEGRPEATFHTSTFELFRVLHGRRTVEQVRAMKWDGDPGAWPENIFIFGPTRVRVEG